MSTDERQRTIEQLRHSGDPSAIALADISERLSSVEESCHKIHTHLTGDKELQVPGLFGRVHALETRVDAVKQELTEELHSLKQKIAWGAGLLTAIGAFWKFVIGKN